MRDLSTEKGIAQLHHLMMALRTEGVSNQLSTIAISWMQLLAGTSSFVFEDVSTSLPHLYLMTWLPSIRKFLHRNNMTLEMEMKFVPSLQ